MDIDRALEFPEGFLWGTAACAHQAEGGNVHNDWWDFEQQKGNIRNGDKSGKCNNHYELYESDFELLASMNQNAHRMGIEWSRIFPEEDRINNDEIDHYKKVLETAAQKGLTVHATTHHFTSPLWFAKKGGFLEEKNLDHFKRYIETIAIELGALVPFWNTINEPAIYVVGGWLSGDIPPGHKNMGEAVRVLKNIILAHGIAYNGIHEHCPGDAKVGIVKAVPHFVPKDPANEADVAAAENNDNFFNEYQLRAIDEGVFALGDREEEVPSLKKSTDFYGLNYYSQMICDGANPFSPEFAREGEPTSQMGWGVHPQGLYASIMRLKKYNLPIYITENGTATNDEQWRIDYIAQHLQAVHTAINDRADVRGYFHWTSVDNFEWNTGWMPRFGLISFDPDTFERTVKRGGKFYTEVAGENALTPEIMEKYSEKKKKKSKRKKSSRKTKKK